MHNYTLDHIIHRNESLHLFFAQIQLIIIERKLIARSEAYASGRYCQN